MSEDNKPIGRRSGRTILVLGVVALLGAIGFATLGIWQVERLAWKNALVEAVDTRAHAEPLMLAEADWSTIDPAVIEYQRVQISGTLLPQDSFVQAVTVHGGGFWVMTPLRDAAGRIVLVNRGYVPGDARDSVLLASETPAVINGLLRPTEPDGGFLRSNDPAGDRWYSRDVAAIAAADGLAEVAPFFIDADVRSDGDYPIGGLTVMSFTNNHLIYALTWFGLSAMLLAGFGYVLWDRRRSAR